MDYFSPQTEKKKNNLRLKEENKNHPQFIYFLSKIIVELLLFFIPPKAPIVEIITLPPQN